MKGFLLITLFLSLGLASANGQRHCGSMDYLEQQIQDNPERIKNLNKIERQVREFEGQVVTRDIVTIPVVFHIVYRTPIENISESQIQSQIDVLNEDFRMLNSDATTNWSQAADTEIEFCLATVDPFGNVTSGITRTLTTVDGFGTNDAVKFGAQGGIDAWPTGDYLNIWVCNIGNGILGYAQFPGGPESTDGIVNGYQYTGTLGTATSPFDLGRTATHEVGHWLNLKHIWGEGCDVDDSVADTPQSDAPNFGCASGHTSCGSTDMVENFMDYSDDSCMNLFTLGQKTRMDALFGPGGSRESILSSNGCGIGSFPTCVDGIHNGNETGIDCGGPDCANCPTCDDGVQNGDETAVDCGGSCTACPIDCNENIVVVSITLDIYPEETSWKITNSFGNTVAEGGTYGNLADNSTVEVQVCLADGCYDFTIYDTYNDGICCAYGDGSYTVTSGGEPLATGGSFASSETTNICLSGSPLSTCEDGVQNGEEAGIDCGGPDCINCPTCDDGIQNGEETGIDCGGSCIACIDTCTNVSVSITLDNYPEETSWALIDSNGNSIAFGGTYAAEPKGSTLNFEECLVDGCYDFTIFDAYGDGICCSYGNGSYSVSAGGVELASGGTFGASETTSICIEEAESTCDDGIQNGEETGIDCGGSCEACPTSGESDLLGAHYFESGWDGWNDGGSDCYRYYGANSWEGNYSIRIRDNSGSSSSMISSEYELSNYESVNVEFHFYPNSMESGEEFWFRYDDGNGWQTVATYISGLDFNNDIFYSASVSLESANHNLVNGGRFSFQCNASGNADRIYLDQITVTGVQSGSRVSNAIRELGSRSTAKYIDRDNDIHVYPNPAIDRLFISAEEEINVISIYSITGQLVYKNEKYVGFESEIDISTLRSGIYLMSVETEEEVITEKFMKE